MSFKSEVSKEDHWKENNSYLSQKKNFKDESSLRKSKKEKKMELKAEKNMRMFEQQQKKEQVNWTKYFWDTKLTSIENEMNMNEIHQFNYICSIDWFGKKCSHFHFFSFNRKTNNEKNNKSNNNKRNLL